MKVNVFRTADDTTEKHDATCCNSLLVAAAVAVTAAATALLPLLLLLLLVSFWVNNFGDRLNSHQAASDARPVNIVFGTFSRTTVNGN